jgi:Sugar phosphate isomerases/epimerases
LDNTPREVITEAKDIIYKHGMELSVHAPFLELNIAAFCSGIREESIRVIKKSVDFSEQLRAKTLVVHSGEFTFDTIPENNRTNDNIITKKQWNHNIDSLRSINDYANSKDITVCLENIGLSPHSIDRCFEDLLEIRENVGDSLRFTLDMGHARLTEGAEKGIRLLGDSIYHIHLTDNLGKHDDHLPLGDGNYDYSNYAKFLRDFLHIIILEVVEISTDPKPVIRAKNALNTLLSQ